MKRVLIWILIIITVIVSAYFIITRNGLPIVTINNIKSITVNAGAAGENKQYSIENNKEEIKKFISMYNKAKRYYRDGDTTTEFDIVFELQNGKKITIQGNSQSYQYVYVNGKHYKISGKELTNFMRTLRLKE